MNKCCGFLYILLALTGCSTTQLHTTSNALIVADWAQTRYIAANPQQFHELSPLLGSHPSVGAVNRHFVGSLLVNNAIYYVLPENGKRNWSLIVTGVEGTLVAHNASIGIRFNW